MYAVTMAGACFPMATPCQGCALSRSPNSFSVGLASSSMAVARRSCRQHLCYLVALQVRQHLRREALDLAQEHLVRHGALVELQEQHVRAERLRQGEQRVADLGR